MCIRPTDTAIKWSDPKQDKKEVRAKPSTLQADQTSFLPKKCISKQFDELNSDSELFYIRCKTVHVQKLRFHRTYDKDICIMNAREPKK